MGKRGLYCINEIIDPLPSDLFWLSAVQDVGAGTEIETEPAPHGADRQRNQHVQQERMLEEGLTGIHRAPKNVE